MKTSIAKISRPVRRRLKRIMHKSKDHRHARCAHAILLLHEGYSISGVARILKAARSAIRVWYGRFEAFGESGLFRSRLAAGLKQ